MEVNKKVFSKRLSHIKRLETGPVTLPSVFFIDVGCKTRKRGRIDTHKIETIYEQ